MPTISVIIPTYNRPDLLIRALNSVYAQTHTDFEVIVVDDGNKPRAESTISSFISKPNFRYIETTKNTGGASARNRGIEEARGEWVAFLDDDDEWVPEKLAKQIHVTNLSDDIAYVFSAVERRLSNDSKTYTDVPHGEGNYFERALTRFAGVLTSTLLVKKDVLKYVGGFDDSLLSHQEAELMIRIAKDETGYAINESLAIIHEEGHAHIGGNLERRIRGRERVLAKHREEFEKRPHILAKHLFNIGIWYRDIGQRNEARQKFTEAFGKHKHPRYLLHMVLACTQIKMTWLVNLSLIFGSILCALIIGEVLLRIILPLTEPPTFAVEEQGDVLRPDDILGHTIVPGSLYHDEFGFKNDSVLDTYDIVVLGDSHTYGMYGSTGKDVSWPNLLRDQTDKTVYNMGVWGYGPAEYAYVLDSALQFKPKTVLVGLYLGNDLFNAYDAIYHREYWKDYRSPDFVDEAPVTSATFKETKIPFRGIRDFFRNNSVLYSFLGDRTRLLRERLGFSNARNVGVMDWSNTDPEVSLKYTDRPELETLFWAGSRVKGVDLSDKNITEGMRLTEDLLHDMKLKSWRNGAEFILILIPSKELAYESILGDEKIGQNVLISKIIEDETEIKEHFVQFCDREGIVCVDLTPVLSEQLHNGEALYPPNWDEHPIEAGYRVYAEGVANYIHR